MGADQGKQFVDKSARMVRENLQKGAIRPPTELARGLSLA